jgi:hypothetical protein
VHAARECCQLVDPRTVPVGSDLVVHLVVDQPPDYGATA